MTVVTVETVSKRYPGLVGEPLIVALDDISLQLHENEVVALVGPSGCGKTTLLRIMAGLEKPDSGQVWFDRQPLSEVALQDRGIGMVFQDFALIPHWKARRSVGFFLQLRHREEEVPARVEQVSRITGVGIDLLMDRFPRQLSGGEKQRVAIARAFARDMRLLLFDEPFANLDAKFRTAARLELRRLLNQFEVTAAIATHDQHEASALAHRIVVMREGQVEQIGTYQHLYDSPRNLFVAQFIGTPTINAFPGHVGEGRWYGENFGGYPIRRDLPDGTAVTLGIRPEHIYLKSGGIPAVVEQITPYYAEGFILLDVWLAHERWQLQLSQDTHVQRGETIYCELDHTQALYFDTRTGARIG